MNSYSQAEDRLDQVFINAFETNHPAMLDWVEVKFELKKLRAFQKEILDKKNIIEQTEIEKLQTKD